MKLFPKLLICFLSLSILPLCILSITIYVTQSKSLIQEEARDLEEISLGKTLELSNFFRMKEGEAALLGHSESIFRIFQLSQERVSGERSMISFREETDEIYAKLEQLSVVYDVEKFAMVSVDGTILLSEEEDALTGRDVSANPLLETIFRRALLLLEPVVSHIQRDPITSEMTVLVAAPILKGGKCLGVLAFHIPQSQLNGFFQDYSGLRKTGEFLVGRRQGDYLYFLLQTRHAPDEFFSIKMGSHLALPMQNAVQGINGQGMSIDYRGEKIYAVWEYFPYLDMGMVVKKDFSEMAEGRNALRNAFWGFGIFTALLTIVIVFFLSRNLSNPLRLLESGMRRVGEGDFTHKVSVETKDEIGSVSRTFDEMIEKLKTSTTSITKLHEEVEKRQKSEMQMADFLAIMTHELRGPIIPVIEALAITLQRDLPKEEREFLEIAHTNAQRLLLIANDLLDYRKMQEGRMIYAKAPEDVNGLIQQATQNFLLSIQTKGLHLELDLAGDLPLVECDKNRIMQVLSNLISNALKFTKKGQITLSTHRLQDEVKVGVSDTGIGIDTKDFDKLFKSFIQLESKDGEKHTGSGLGLVICKKIIEAHDGKIWVEANGQAGASFFFTLPLSVRKLD